MSSSETTSSSRLSQFGLYRTIDARTEEFLKLSRKRQIRQGCACAAVSTAITVTVVITVLLIYEYSINPVSNPEPTRKLNWHGLFNDTARFESKFNKAKINIDSTTLKLLPIILKALNHNRYLEKLIEDSSSSPLFDKKDTTEFSYKKNVFSDAKNWIRNPSTKMSALEYKTLPVTYYKNPTSNLDYYTKIRKIRDYQRVMNYFDKMINEKNPLGSTLPMIKEQNQSERPSVKQTTIPMTNKMRSKPSKQVFMQHLNSNNVLPKKDVINCKCTKKFNELLRKLVLNIQELLPELNINKSPCKHNHTSTTSNEPPKIRKDKNVTKLPSSKTIAILKNEVKKIVPVQLHKHEPASNTEKVYAEATPEYNIDKLSTHESTYDNVINNILIPNYLKKRPNSLDLKSKNNEIVVSTTEFFYIEPTEKKIYLSQKLTKSMLKMTQTTPTKPSKTIKENHNSKNKKVVSVTEADSIVPFFKDNFSKDYNFATMRGVNQFDDLDIHSIELVKGKILSVNKEYNKLKKENEKHNEEINVLNFKPIPNSFKHEENITKSTIAASLQTETISSTTSKSGTKKLQTTSNEITAKTITITPIITEIASIKEDDNLTDEIEKERRETSTKQSIAHMTPQNAMRFHETLLDDDDNKVIIEEDFQEEEVMKQDDTSRKPIVTKYNPQSLRGYPSSTVKSIETQQPEYNENIRLIKSMLPRSRPIYLEIHRNDWKNDNHDYDTNLENTMFDIFK